MATQPNETAKTPKPKTVVDDMPARRVFNTTDEAAAYLNESASTYADFARYPLVANGIDSEGNFDPAVYTDGMRVLIATLSERVKGQPSTIKAIVVTPAPSLDALMASELGRAMVESVIDKELNHRAVRPLRDASDVSAVADQMPLTIEAYCTSGRESQGIMESFNDLQKTVNDFIAGKVKIWAKARLTKPEFKKALESRAYALAYYPALEDRGEGKESLFVTALNAFKQLASKKGMDAAIFDRWLATRNNVALKDADDADDIDFEGLELPTEEPAADSNEKEVETVTE